MFLNLLPFTGYLNNFPCTVIGVECLPNQPPNFVGLIQGLLTLNLQAKDLNLELERSPEDLPSTPSLDAFEFVEVFLWDYLTHVTTTSKYGQCHYLQSLILQGGDYPKVYHLCFTEKGNFVMLPNTDIRFGIEREPQGSPLKLSDLPVLATGKKL